MSHYVYILLCENNSFYTGYTTHVARRYQEHRSRSNKCRYTRSFPPKKLAAVWCFDDKSSALKEEARIKKLTKIEKQKMIERYENEHHQSKKTD